MTEEAISLVAPDPPSRLSEAELRSLALDVVEGRVFITNSAEGMRNAFSMILMFVDLRPIAGQISAVYERVEKAGPRGINGYPFFTSMQLLHVDDLGPLHERIDEYESARADFVKGAL